MTTTPELLGGLPTDYEILVGGIPRNRVTGEMGRANNVNGYIFRDLRAYIVNGKMSAPVSAATPALSAQDQADLALGREVRRLVKP